jgi:hypothetical protein
VFIRRRVQLHGCGEVTPLELIGTTPSHLRNAHTTRDRPLGSYPARGDLYSRCPSQYHCRSIITTITILQSSNTKPKHQQQTQLSAMPSPFHQKYSSQSHKAFGDNTTPAMPEAPKQDAERRGSDSSTTEPAGRRRSSAAQRFGNLEALKRPTDTESVNRRSSLHDSYGKPGFIGTMWNK